MNKLDDSPKGTGVIPAPDGFLVKVRQLCEEYELLLIVEEVQTGVGRTGDFFLASLRVAMAKNPTRTSRGTDQPTACR